MAECARRRALSSAASSRASAAACSDGRHRYAYVAAHSTPSAANGFFDQLARLDVQTGRAERVWLRSGAVPLRAGARAPARGERRGRRPCSHVHDGIAHASHLAVLDAARLGDGPIARVHFDHPVPFTFHGKFARA